MEEFNKAEQADFARGEDVVSIPVRAGRRTYFFDLKKTKADNHYLVITESQKKFDDSQLKHTFQKQKIFVYKDNLLNFAKALNAIIDYTKENIGLEEEIENHNEKMKFSNDISDEDFLKEIGLEETDN